MLLEQYRDQLGWHEHGVLELGSGDATSIAEVVARLPELTVRGYDISADSVAAARRNIAARGVADRYRVEVGDFFEAADARPPVPTVISNPPYIPAPDGDILMPELWGGVYGNDLVLRLLKSGHQNVITAVPSYSDPLGTLTVAADLGYRVGNFLATALDFGRYSSEPKVRAHIRRIVAEGRGWAGEGEYMVAIALFTQHPDVPGDRGEQLRGALQLGR
jgi:methylase of polypeptide subunit release factors